MQPEVLLLDRKSQAPLDGDQSSRDETQAVCLGELLEEIDGLLRRYIAFPAEHLAMLTACWIAGTYLYERFAYFGYLALRSPTPRCGKTHVLQLVALLAQGKPPKTMMPTAAVLFRSTRAVLILDEVDRLRNADKETFGDVIAVLDGGFERGGVVERMERAKGGGFEVKSYPVFGPKALAGIEKLADTLADRSFQIQMQRTRQRMPRLNERRLEGTARPIREKLAAWAAAHEEEVEQAYENLPDETPDLAQFDDRFQDISEPLMVLASLADAERAHEKQILPKLIAGLTGAAGRREVSARERQLLAFLEIAEARLIMATEVFIPSADLLDACEEREELSRIETTSALAGFLRHFDLSPSADTTKTKRGYWIRREWVDEWKAIYGGSKDAG